jgi:hypothetical protein
LKAFPEKGNERTRLPIAEELDRLREYFGRIRDHRPSSMPMQKILAPKQWTALVTTIGTNLLFLTHITGANYLPIRSYGC